MRKLLIGICFFGLAALGRADDTVVYVATTGNDSTGDGTSGNPYATPEKGMSFMDPGGILYIKAGTYTDQDEANGAVLYLDAPATTKAVTVHGWGSSTTTLVAGDLATLNAASTLADGVKAAATGLYVFENIQATSATNTGWFVTNLADSMWVNCGAKFNGDEGFDLDNTNILTACFSEGNTGYGFQGDIGNRFTSCKSTDDGNGFSSLQDSTYAHCTIENMGNQGISIGGVSSIVIHCTIDGRATGGTEGVDAGAHNNLLVINSIIRDCAVGLFADSDGGRSRAEHYNFIYSCATPRTAWSVGLGSDTSTDPQHTDAPNGDYSLATGSAALGAALTNPAVEASIGAWQLTTAGGGGAAQLVGGGLVQ